jgi:hypothetical protein
VDSGDSGDSNCQTGGGRRRRPGKGGFDAFAHDVVDILNFHSPFKVKQSQIGESLRLLLECIQQLVRVGGEFARPIITLRAAAVIEHVTAGGVPKSLGRVSPQAAVAVSLMAVRRIHCQFRIGGGDGRGHCWGRVRWEWWGWVEWEVGVGGVGGVGVGGVGGLRVEWGSRATCATRDSCDSHDRHNRLTRPSWNCRVPK